MTELKLFIASAQAGYSTGGEIDALSSEMDALPVQTAGRPLAPEESDVRSQWIGLVYLTLDRLAAQTASDADAALVPSKVRDEYEPMVVNLLRAKREDIPLSMLDVDAIAPSSGAASTARSKAELALLKQAMRVVYLTLDNVEAEKQAGTRADVNKLKNPNPPKPFIPGTG